ncbi:hypothetical protein AKJ16_DCAP02484 [Drosera capensis]
MITEKITPLFKHEETTWSHISGVTVKRNNQPVTIGAAAPPVCFDGDKDVATNRNYFGKTHVRELYHAAAVLTRLKSMRLPTELCNGKKKKKKKRESPILNSETKRTEMSELVIHSGLVSYAECPKNKRFEEKMQ